MTALVVPESAPLLQGKHVRLEPLAVEHIDGLNAAGVDESIWTWLPWRLETRDEYTAFVLRILQAQATGNELPWATVNALTGEVVGMTRLFFVSPHDRRVEIGGTWLAPQAQRTATNTEAKLLQLTYCFETLRCIRVELKTDARNEKSRNAMLRIGAQFEGIMRKHMRTRGGFQRDSAYFAIVDDDWPQVKARLEGLLARP
jgi:RimJ/RimL family protein N-acetyltransferase